MELVDDRLSDMLSGKQEVTVILRLLMDEQGKLVHGNLVDVDGQSRGRFSDWGDLVSLLQQWLDSQERRGS
jgi:hypothetical protein